MDEKTIAELLEQRVTTYDEVLYFDPNSIFKAVLKGNIQFNPIPNKRCVVSGHEAIGFKTSDMDTFLRPDIFQRLILSDLRPSEWRKLIRLFPDEHHIESDFYTKTGLACQSKAEYMPIIHLYIPVLKRPTGIFKLRNKTISSSVKLG